MAKSKVPAQIVVVRIASELRKQFRWLESLIAEPAIKAEDERRKQEAKKLPEMNGETLEVYTNEFIELQKKLNPLLARRKEIINTVFKPFWGLFGDKELKRLLGTNGIILSLFVGVAPDKLEPLVGEQMWRKLTKRELQAMMLLMLANSQVELRDKMEKALVVKVDKVSFRAPNASSDDTEEEEAAVAEAV